MNITAPDSGEIRILGAPMSREHPEPDRLPARGARPLPEDEGHRPPLLPRRDQGVARETAKKRIGDWLDKMELRPWLNKKVDELSKGMQQKVQFIATIVHDPEILILDELFSGLDPINTAPHQGVPDRVPRPGQDDRLLDARPRAGREALRRDLPDRPLEEDPRGEPEGAEAAVRRRPAAPLASTPRRRRSARSRASSRSQPFNGGYVVALAAGDGPARLPAARLRALRRRRVLREGAGARGDLPARRQDAGTRRNADHRVKRDAMSWKKIFAVIRREYIERVRTKAFWIGTLLVPILFLGFIAIQIASFKKTGGERTLAVVDLTGHLFAPLQKELDERGGRAPQEGRPNAARASTGSSSSGPVAGSLEATKETLRNEVLEKKLDGYLVLDPALIEKSQAEYYSIDRLGIRRDGAARAGPQPRPAQGEDRAARASRRTSRRAREARRPEDLQGHARRARPRRRAPGSSPRSSSSSSCTRRSSCTASRSCAASSRRRPTASSRSSSRRCGRPS